jgi:hypothetical protein
MYIIDLLTIVQEGPASLQYVQTPYNQYPVCRYDLLALTASLLWLIAGTKFVLGLYDRINYVMHRPNDDVSWFLTLFRADSPHVRVQKNMSHYHSK